MNGKLLSESELAQYAKGETLIDRLRGLLDHQKENWETVRKNYDLLNSVQIEEIKTDNSVIKLQVNPERIRSTAAEVNHNANANDCFLCEENLPQNQRLLKYYKEYNFLVNPFPIFPEHFTVAKTKHTPQALFPYLNDMLLLSRDVGERYVVFYNGPKCGASIPSHHHFQIVNKEPLPIYNLVNSPSAFKSNFALENKKITVRNFSLDNRIFLHLESNDAIEIMKRKHRPDFYYMTGERQMLVSPAAIDMAGLIILPREEDVVKLKEENILQMYREVSITKELNEYLITKLKAFYT
jgi:hypothetical protein